MIRLVFAWPFFLCVFPQSPHRWLLSGMGSLLLSHSIYFLKKYHRSPCSHHHHQSHFRQQLLFKVLYVSPSVVLPSSCPNFISPHCQLGTQLGMLCKQAVSSSLNYYVAIVFLSCVCMIVDFRSLPASLAFVCTGVRCTCSFE